VLSQLKGYLDAARSLDADAFAERLPEHVFLVPQVVGAVDELGRTAMRRVELSGQLSGPVSVARLEKKAGSKVMRGLITIGRAATNDVCVATGEVSKFHAYLQRDGEVFELTDAGSTNGTFVNGCQLEPKKDHAPLVGGDRINLGNLVLIYHTPATFHAHLRRLLGLGE
jgi:FHA domain